MSTGPLFWKEYTSGTCQERFSMDGAHSSINLFLIILAIAGGSILVNGLIDLGLAPTRQRVESLIQRLNRSSSRQKSKTAISPPR